MLKYNQYLKKLKQYAKICGVNITFSNSEYINSIGGKYNRTQRKILISKKLKPQEIIATILHELGHFMDNHRNPERMLNSHYLYAEEKIKNFSPALTGNQKDILWDSELEAWKNGEALAAQLKIKLGKWFFKDRMASLNTYRTIKKE